MPTYAYRCDDCDVTFEVFKAMSDSDIPEACPGCEGETRKVPNWGGNTILKGDDWTSKNNRVAGQMAKKRQGLRVKEEEAKREGRVPSLVPNVEGEQCENWTDAKKLAKSKGKNTSGHDKFIAKEKAKTSKISP